MSRGIWLLLLAGAALGCSASAPPNQMAATPKPDPVPERQAAAPVPITTNRTGEIAARINNEIITWKDVKEILKEIKPADLTLELKKAKLRELAEERMFLQAAKKNNLNVTEQELDEAQRRDIKMYGSEDEFERVIRIKFGTKTAYREDKRRQILIYKLYRHLLQQSWTNPGKDTPGLMLDFVAPEKIREYYSQHPEQFQAIERISFMRIGLQVTLDRDEETKQRLAESVTRKLDEGAEFAMLAFFYSDIRRAKDFRDMGVSRKDCEQFYSAETIKYLFDVMKEGETSPIIKDGRSFNIFKMEQKINQKAETFEEAQGKIRSMMENQYREENRKKLRDHLRKDAYLWPPDLFDYE
jgi:parvulin-like peptidyl-prolyl cis-trans isomerase-like protein